MSHFVDGWRRGHPEGVEGRRISCGLGGKGRYRGDELGDRQAIFVATADVPADKLPPVGAQLVSGQCALVHCHAWPTCDQVRVLPHSPGSGDHHGHHHVCPV